MSKISNWVNSSLMISMMAGALVASGCNQMPSYIHSLVYCGTVTHKGKTLSGGNIIYHFKWYSNGAYSEGDMTPAANPNGTGNIDANGVACAQGKIGSAIEKDFNLISISGTSIVDAEGNTLPDTGEVNENSNFDSDTQDLRVTGDFHVGDLQAKNQSLKRRLRDFLNLDRVKVAARESISDRHTSGRVEDSSSQPRHEVSAGAAI